MTSSKLELILHAYRVGRKTQSGTEETFTLMIGSYIRSEPGCNACSLISGFNDNAVTLIGDSYFVINCHYPQYRHLIVEDTPI